MKLSQASALVRLAKAAEGEPVVIQLATGFTPLSLQTFLTAFVHQRVPLRSVTVRTGTYGDVAGTLRRFVAETAEYAACVIEWEDLDPRLALRSAVPVRVGDLDDIVTQARASAARLASLLGTLREIRPASLVLPTLQLPPFFPTPSGQFSIWEIELQQIRLELARAATLQRVRVVSPGTESRAAEIAVQSELSFGFPYSSEHASKVAQALVDGLLRETPRRKGLVVDLDNTLWKGVVGDDGVDSVSWSLADGSHEHALVQRAAEFWASAGVLVGVASKNDAALAGAALDRSDLIVRRESLFPIEASWSEKSAAVSRILRTWNIGVDAVVFVDDSELEIAEVSTSHSLIEALRFPAGEPEAVWRLVHRLRTFFGSEELQEEDLLRGDSVRASAEVGTAQQDYEGDAEAFLASLNGEIVLARGSAVRRARALELINKTNQFNLNGVRLSESELAALEAEGSVLVSVSYTDRLSRLGDIAALLVRPQESELLILRWVMSCRAFSRRIEHATLDALTKAFDARTVCMQYLSTPRNGPTTQFLLECGSTRDMRTLDITTLTEMLPAQRPASSWREVGSEG